ncbi:tape measure protein [Peptococcus simiae]|uniref:tape measure protein n=1 Tax=Peptococcus simiae TaxID=1643805 RepID=UPI003980803E
MGSVRGAMILDDRMTSVLKATTQALHMVVDGMASMNDEMGRTPDMSQLAAAKRQLQGIDRDFASIEREVGAANAKQKQFNTSLNNGAKHAGLLESKMKGVLAAVVSVAGAASGLKAFANYADDMARIDGRISIINDGLQTNDAIQERILQKSYESGANFKSMADMVSRIGTSASGAFKNTNEIVDFAGELNKMFVIAGTSAQGIDAAMLQMTQALAKGKLQGQEFNSIMEQAPGVINAIAKHLGVSTGQLKQMAAEGQITSQVIKDSVLGAAAETAEAFNQIPWTLTGGIANRLKTAVTMALKPAAGQFTALVNSEEFHKAFEGLVQAIYAFGRALLVVVNISAAVFKFMVNHWDGLKFIILPLVSVIGVLMVAALVKMAAVAVMAGVSMFASMMPVLGPLMLIAAGITWITLGLQGMGISWQDAGRAAVGVGYAIMAMLRNLDRKVYNAAERLRTCFRNAWEKVKESAASALNFIATEANKLFAKFNSSKLAKKAGVHFDMLGEVHYTADYAEPKTVAYESIGDAYKKGHDEGFNSIGDKVGGALDRLSQVQKNLSKGIGQAAYDQAAPATDDGAGGKTAGDRVRAGKLDKIAGNTDKIKESLKIANEDLSYMRKWEEGRRAAQYNIENKIKVETTIDRPDATFDIDGYTRDLGVGLLTQLDITKGGLSPE